MMGRQFPHQNRFFVAGYNLDTPIREDHVFRKISEKILTRRAHIEAEYHRPTLPEFTYSYKAGVGSGKTSIEYYRQRVSYRPQFSLENCRHQEGCSACVEICPSGALTKGAHTPCLEKSECMGCSACREACDFDGLRLQPDEKLMEELTSETVPQP
jgi:Na+-translocating ferredoxin:NAD+ oxidoreductase RNF subunit RnfB